MSTKKTFAPGVGTIGSVGTYGTAITQIQAQNAYGFSFIPYDNIIPNELNDRYNQIDLESLSLSIEDNGLLHNIVVTNTDEAGKYRLISGERRWRAIGLLKERNPERYLELFPGGLIPTKVQSLDGNIVDEEIQLIVANSAVRTIDINARLVDIQRLAELYATKVSENPSKTAISEMIAKQLDMSERQIRKYMNLDKLVPELRRSFDEKSINIETASKIAILGETEQLYLVDILNESGRITDDDIDAAKLLQSQKENAQKEIDAKTNEIKTLESMRAGAKSKEETEFIETKIASRQKDIDKMQKSMSYKELTMMRKLTKANKAVEQIDTSIEKLQNLWDYAKTDTTIMLRVEMLQMKMNQLLGQKD